MENTLINGDCLESLRKIPDNSIDSMVTDPPAGIAFMGKKWDKDKGGRKLWIAWLESIMTEAFRTLKPGAHVLVWAIPRTSHWTATAIENAEFEIRDVVTHIFGSGFPKSQNISKALDRQAGHLLANVIELKKKLVILFDASGKSRKQIDQECGFRASNYLVYKKPGEDKRPDPWINILPPQEKWQKMKSVLGLVGGSESELDVFFAHAEREVLGYKKVAPGCAFTSEGPSEMAITEPATDAAKQWDGWGSALKPASEHWILARKPLSEKTIAANVLEHGTGGINIDASRITTTDNLNGGAYAKNPTHRAGQDVWTSDRKEDTKCFERGGAGEYEQPKGRFPANLILSHKPGCKQVGTKEGKGYTINRFTDGAKPFGNGAGHPYKVEDQGPETIAVWECDDNCAVKQLGEENRFFYCAKASKKEKTLNKTIENKHPTVKSLKLMKYLINLVTPPGGVVLDPFMGSGTTGQAALEDNFGFVGVELEADSFDICKNRCSSIKTLIVNKEIEEKSIDQADSV